LLQVFLPLSHAWSAAAHDTESGNTVLICTHWGMQAVSVDELGTGHLGEIDHSSCPDCQLQSLTLLSPETAVPYAPTSGLNVGWAPEHSFRLTSRYPTGTPPRGPPANA
jgi:hypothetical protein